jgi:hypothetical protein
MVIVVVEGVDPHVRTAEIEDLLGFKGTLASALTNAMMDAGIGRMSATVFHQVWPTVSPLLGRLRELEAENERLRNVCPCGCGGDRRDW